MGGDKGEGRGETTVRMLYMRKEEIKKEGKDETQGGS